MEVEAPPTAVVPSGDLEENDTAEKVRVLLPKCLQCKFMLLHVTFENDIRYMIFCY